MIEDHIIVGRQQRPIFIGIEARVVKRVAAIVAAGFPVPWPGVEHEQRGWRGVRAESLEHRPLSMGGEMEKAIPRQHAFVSLPERKFPAYRLTTHCCSGNRARQRATSVGALSIPVT